MTEQNERGISKHA